MKNAPCSIRVQLIIVAIISLMFSAVPLLVSLLFDKSSLGMASLIIWYGLFPPLLLFVLSLLLNIHEGNPALFMGKIWMGVGVWFALQLVFHLASPIFIMFRLMALPAITVGGKGFIAGTVLFLLGGIVLFKLGEKAKRWTIVPGTFARRSGIILIAAVLAAALPAFMMRGMRVDDRALVDDAKLPSQAEIFSWIRDVYNMGERRTGSAADSEAVGYLEKKLREVGISDVRTEPFQFDYWEAESWGLTLKETSGAERRVDSFYVPYSAPTGKDGTIGDLVYVGTGTKADFKKADVRGKVVLAELPAVNISWDKMKIFSYLAFDPQGSTENWEHPYPIGWMFKYEAVYELAREHGAAGIVGILQGYPDLGKFTYYAPYDGVLRTIPSLYVMERDGNIIKEVLKKGGLKARLVLAAKAVNQGGRTATVYGILPGMSETALIVHCHHDAPWQSGIEDSSGVGMVLALAKYFAGMPKEKRDRTMIFMLTGSHMVGARGNYDFIEKHRKGLLENVLYDICIEHIADDYNPPQGATGNPEPRGVFITENPVMLSTYARLVKRHNIHRLLVFPTGSPLGVPTDAQPFHNRGYNVTTMISGPSWLFDDDDTLERVDKGQLVPVTRLYIDLISQMGREADWMLSFNLNWLTIALIVVVLSPLSILGLRRKS